MTRKFEIVSADVHITEPPDIWKNHLPKKYQEHAPVLAKDPEGGDAWQFAVGQPEPIGLTVTPGQRFEEMRWFGMTYDNVRPSVYNGKARIEDMDVDGIDAEIIFPPQRTIGHWLGNADEEISLAGVDAFNAFSFDEFAAADPARLFPMYQIPLLGVDTAVKYVKKAKERGAKGVVIGGWPTGGETISDEDDAFWAACVDEGLPVTIHITMISRAARMAQQKAGKSVTSDIGKDRKRMNQKAVGGLAGVFSAVPPTIAALIFSGVFDRFPELRVALIEIGVGWIPHFLEMMDDRYWRNRTWAGLDIKREPSYYWYHNFAATFMQDYIGVKLRHAVGIENMMWSTDFPHHGNDWPYSRTRINEMFNGVDQTEKAKIVAGNAVRIFGLDK